MKTWLPILVFLLLAGFATALSPKVEILAEEEHIYYAFSPTEVVVMKIEDPDIALTSITVRTYQTYYDAGIQVTRIKEPDVPLPKNFAYQYYDIDGIQVPPSGFSSVIVRFRVDAVWLAEYQIDKNSIALLHYDKGWKRLQTRIEKETDGDAYYVVTSVPGFSYFAIVGEGLGLVNETSVEAPVQEAPPAPIIIQQAASEDPPWLIWATVALGIVALGFLGSTFIGLMKEKEF